MDPQTVPQFTAGEKISPDRQTNEQWTNEKHVRFLNSMESRFIRTMMEDSDRFLRLDRHLPDSAESTLDSKSMLERGKKHAISVNFVGTRTGVINGRHDKRLRRPSSHPYDSSKDQVVPEVENRRGVAIASMASTAATN